MAGQFYRVANMAALARSLLTPAKISRVVACGVLSRRHRDRRDRNAAERAAAAAEPAQSTPAR